MDKHDIGRAAGELFDQFGDRVYRFCFRLTGHPQEAEDLAADTFFDAARQLNRFEGRSSLETLLYRIALNKWRMLARQRAVRSRLTPWAQGERTTELGEAIEISAAIDALPLKLREAFILVKVEGFSHENAAEILKCPAGTVRARVFAAREKLRRFFENEIPTMPLVVAQENVK